MTVKELIKELEEYDDLPVVIFGPGELDPLTEVMSVSMTDEVYENKTGKLVKGLKSIRLDV